MRNWIDAVAESAVRGTLLHKPLRDVTDEDVMRAMLAAHDLRDVIQNHWGQMDWGYNGDEPIDEPPIPRSSDALTPAQLAVMLKFYTETPQLSQVRQELAPYAAMEVIPITRRLNRLSDLSKPLGVHWSQGELTNEATSFYGDIVVFGLVRNENVDWITSLARGQFWWDEEREIAVVAGAPITLLRVDFPEKTMGRA